VGSVRGEYLPYTYISDIGKIILKMIEDQIKIIVSKVIRSSHPFLKNDLRSRSRS
jgi:hypothetical protein